MFHVRKVENWQYLNKKLFQVHGAIIIPLGEYLGPRVFTLEHLILLSWDLKNQFDLVIG